MTSPGTPSSPLPVSNSTLRGVKSFPNGSEIIIMAIIIAIVACVLAIAVLLWHIIQKKRINNDENNGRPTPPESFSSKSDVVNATQYFSIQLESTVTPDGVNAIRSFSTQLTPVATPDRVNATQFFSTQSTSTATPDGANATQFFSTQLTSTAIPAGVNTNGVLPALGDTSRLDNSQSGFTHEQLAIATNRFARQNLLGEGGFGLVYKGSLEGGKLVAVKKLKTHGLQGEREFRAEVDTIRRVHHPHLVNLVGYCSEYSERLLVYEFVPNGTLEYHLHERERPVMEWPTRQKIAIGVARGIAYLHEDCHPQIIHRDIKSANILLDNNFEAQVSDFGLAKFAVSAHSQVTSHINGTRGYMAPECLGGSFSQRSDVYSFGVVLLELVTGRKAVYKSDSNTYESLVHWAQTLLSRAIEGNFEAFVDPRLENNFDRGEMIRMIKVAGACISHSGQERPQMGEVVRALESDAGMSYLKNGANPGPSTMYSSGDINRFQRMAFGRHYTGSDFEESVVNRT